MATGARSLQASAKVERAGRSLKSADAMRGFLRFGAERTVCARESKFAPMLHIDSIKARLAVGNDGLCASQRSLR
jgi:hypothetical protein